MRAGLEMSTRTSPDEVTGRSSLEITLAGWVAGLLITVLVLLMPGLTAGFPSPSLHVVLDTADACIALLVAYLVHGRFLRNRRMQDRLLAQGLILLATASLFTSSAFENLPGVEAGSFDIWLPWTIRITGSIYILGSALADTRPVRQAVARRHAWLLPIVVLVLLSLTLWVARSELPVAFDETLIRPSAEPPLLAAHPILLIGQGLSASCFFIASIAVAKQASRRNDALLPWLGPAFALGGFARVNYLLFPSLYTDWLYTGDLLRTGCYVLLLVGAVRELNQYWTARSRLAVLEDRRRLARELHDGVIQEITYIRHEGCTLPSDLPVRDRITAACDRALDEARAAIQALGSPSDEPLGFALHRGARELAERYAVDLEVDVDDSIVVGQEQRHDLLRITREAVANGVRHGKADRLQVQLRRDGTQRRLVIQDNGQGFDVDQVVASRTGYGLVSMRDRARSLPGVLDIDAAPGRGTVVTVTW